MRRAEKLVPEHKEHPFLWLGVLCLGASIALTRLNIYWGTQVNYLDYLSLFNALTLLILACVGFSIAMSMAGLWRARFRSIPLVVMGLASSAYLILLFMID
jgi:hypothetical protein